MILHDVELIRLLKDGWLIAEPDYHLVNSASIDVRLGSSILVEMPDGDWRGRTVGPQSSAYLMAPGEFVLAETLEWLRVPNGYSAELRLKSTRGRQGYQHAISVWFDPGWDGRGTLEITNAARYQRLPLWAGMRFAQMIVHANTGQSLNPYQGRYQGATGVQAAILDLSDRFRGLVEERP